MAQTDVCGPERLSLGPMAVERTSTHDPRLGVTIDGRYKIQSVLGRGSVGVVYLVHDRKQGRPAALKLWHTAQKGEQAQARFLREAEALRTLLHPNIVEVFGVGVFQGHPYVAMEYLEGSTLEDYLTGMPLAPTVALDITRQLLSALSFAHRQGVVHRDLKPENIFLVRYKNSPTQLKLLDFGLAKFLTPESDPLGGAAITVTGIVMGTPLYMPPEQAAGGRVDRRVDVYAAGCILFEMLSGRLPFVGDSYGDLMRAHVTQPIPKLTDVLERTHVAPALQFLLETAMAKNPEYRYPSAGAMLTALQQVPQDPIRRGSAPKLGQQANRWADELLETAVPSKGRTLLLGAAVGASVVGLFSLLLLILLR